MSIYRTIVPMLLVLSVLSLRASADWATDTVKTEKIDFGVIATGSEAKKLVEIRNVHNYDISIFEASTTCGCSAATAGKDVIHPGETGYVEVQMNTQKFKQRKDSNLIIKLMRGNTIQEVRIPITAYIRTDVVFKPGAARFGNVDLGTTGKAVVDITYAGRPDWDIENIKITNPNLKATLSAPERANGLIKYRLSMSLSPETAVGRLRDLVVLVTNDARNPYVPLMVEGAVVSDYTIKPGGVNLGSLTAGQTKVFRVVVRAEDGTPFDIEDLSCPAMADSLAFNLPTAAQPAHALSIQFTAPARPGKFSEQIFVKVTGRERPLSFPIVVTVAN